MSIAAQDAAPVEVEVARSDTDLVARFVAVKDEAAFAELVRRHSGVVMGVCRRVLGNADDVDDVFQATFLVLVRDAARVKKRASLASWLYGVAYRLAVRVAQQKQRRRETEQVDDHSRTSQSGLGDDTLTELVNRYDQQLVDAELNALPDRYRQPLVLRYLVGKSPREVAGELGITIDAVDGLLKRGKDKLRAGLIRRGGLMWATLVAVQLTQQTAQAASPKALIEATVQTGLAWNSANPSALDLISDRVLELSGKELATMTTLTKTGLAIGLTTGALALGLGGAGLLINHLPGRANAGIVSTLPLASSSSRSLEMTALTADPDSGEALVDAGTAPEQPAEVDKSAAPPQRPAIGDEGNVASGLGGGRDPNVGGPANAASLAANGPTKWDFKPRSPLVARIESALTDPTETAFVDSPLHEALAFLCTLHKIEMALDKEALVAEGIATDQLVNLRISGVSLHSGLNLILEPLLLDYVIKNEVLLITTKVKAEEIMETRVYNVARILHLTPKELVEIIVGGSSVQNAQGGSVGSAVGGAPGGVGKASAGSSLPTEPKNGSLISGSVKWEEIQGEGGTAWAGKTTLIIRQTQRVHREIVELLDQLVQEETVQTKTPAVPGGRSGGLNPIPPPPASSFGSEGATGGGFSPAAKGPPGSGGSVPTKPGGR
ncbi:MAG: sigma-70 family RNA polymerase sigma factor [Candidatus Saccharimonas sp.]|nr:sigma-70 family RNA polymerase sigma factor [Planctomycetaceae bacterium]